MIVHFSDIPGVHNVTVTVHFSDIPGVDNVTVTVQGDNGQGTAAFIPRVSGQYRVQSLAFVAHLERIIIKKFLPHVCILDNSSVQFGLLPLT